MAFEMEERWEFCAPHYYDFEVGDAADAQPDAWFDSAQTAGLKTPVALLDKAQTNAAAKQAAAEVTAEQAKENPPSAVKSAAKAARTPGATSATRVLTPRSHNGAMPGSSSRVAKTPATGRSAMGAASRAGGTPFPTEPPSVDDGATDEDSAEYATAGETPGTAFKSVAKSKTPVNAAATPVNATTTSESRRIRAANGAGPHPESHPESSAKESAKESTASKGSSQRARRSARTSTAKKATPEPTAMDVDSPVAAGAEPEPEPEPEPEAAPRSTAIALISPVSSPRTSPRLAAAASARERIEEAAVAMDDDASRARAAAAASSPSPTRQSPRLTAARAAARSTPFVAAKTPGRGPVAGAAASKTPSRFAPTPAPVDPEPASKEPEPASKEPEPVSKPRRRKGLTGGGAVRVLVSEQRVQVEAVEAEAVTLHREEATGERRAMSPARPRRVGASVDPVAEKPPAGTRQQPPAARAVPHVPPAVATRTTRAMAARAAAIAGAKREREPPAPPRTHATRSSAGERMRAKLTVPISPNLSRPPKRARAAQKTSEELALEKSRAAAAEEKERMRVAARRAAARSGGLGGVARAKPSTRPTTPSFARTHRMATRAVVAHGARDENSPFRSVAQTFRKETFKPKEESKSFHNRAPTKPKSPALSKSNAAGRARAKTTEELELEAIAAAPKFRARPVRRAVLKGAGDAAERAKAAAEVRRVAALRAKEGEARKGGWDKQLGRKRGAEAAADEEERAKREAKRRRELELGGHGGFMPPTAPESPRLVTSRRALLKAPAPAPAGANGGVGGGASRVAREPEASVDWSARPLTRPEGFNLTTDKRGAYARKVLERREAEEEEAAAAKRRVVAKPVPATTRRRSSQCFVPNEIKVTQFQPFNLKGEALHEYERKREAQRREEEEAAARARAQFKARPLPFSTFNPMFEVNPSDAAPTVPMDLKLPGDTRAESRARFEEANARRIAEQERARAEEERERVASDERERRRLRRSTVFKARAVPDYAELATVGVAPVPEAELTVPESPFATRRSRRVYRYN